MYAASQKQKRYLVGETIQMVATLLDPRLQVGKGGLAMIQHARVIVKILIGKHVGDRGNDDDGVADGRLAQGVPKVNKIGSLGESYRLVLWIGAPAFNQV